MNSASARKALLLACLSAIFVAPGALAATGAATPGVATTQTPATVAPQQQQQARDGYPQIKYPTDGLFFPGRRARLLGGIAYPPLAAPRRVALVIWAANAISRTPYIWGGGHGGFHDSGYDCSGSVSFALHAAGLVGSPLVSGDYEGWGRSGPGKWITVYANSEHVFMIVAGLRFDTSQRDYAVQQWMKGGTGPRWGRMVRGTAGFVVRHPAGL